MTATAAATITTETPLGPKTLVQVFNMLKSYNQGTLEGYQMDVTPDTKARLRARLDEYGQVPGMDGTVFMVRRYFNTYRQNDWRIVEWQIVAALRLLATVADEIRR